MTIDLLTADWLSPNQAAELDAMEDALEAYAIERQLTYSEAIELQEFQGCRVPGTGRHV